MAVFYETRALSRQGEEVLLVLGAEGDTTLLCTPQLAMGSLTVTVFTYKQSTITHQKVMAMDPMDEEGVDDMATLTELHGGAIMHNLYQRYKRNQIYVSSTFMP
ncbi:hypothetical protein J1605_022659 [Eschrichtius robustus]|uniref:Myosin motor domain-containing protein n=1 Tax=Eschrichtius robustus TaxID=9764 RepID=A0AB34H7Y3_ESCRO|nr:hypothetical protein J1605_022659 [Eschrichtius robustus]